MADAFSWELSMAMVAGRQSAVWIAIWMAGGLLIVAALFSWTARGRNRGPLIVAHRGGAAIAPENTLAAARQAISDGLAWIEIDVHESRDGQVMVIHDEDLKRVGHSELVIRQTDAAQLQDVDVGSWFSPAFRDQRIPTLAELLQTCKGQIGVIIELKHFGHNQQLEERVVRIVHEQGMDDQVMAMSFDANSVRKLKSLRPDWKVGWLTKQPLADPQTVDADFLGIIHEQVTPELIASAHRRKLPVFVWTVNEPALTRKIAAWNADAIITDNPTMVRETLDERSGSPP